MSSQREAFEKINPVPDGAAYNERFDGYYRADYFDTVRHSFNELYEAFQEGWQAATEQGVGEPVYGMKKVTAEIWVPENFDADNIPTGTVLYTHPPKPTECYTKQDCQEEFKRGFGDGWEYGRFVLEVDQAAKSTGGGIPDGWRIEDVGDGYYQIWMPNKRGGCVVGTNDSRIPAVVLAELSAALLATQQPAERG